MATQPGTGLTMFNPQGGALPAHIANFFDEEGTNIQPRTTVSSLSPEGKTWTISIEGQKTKMQRRNQDGDIEPLPIMKVVILDYAKQRGRAYYEGEYDPGNVSAPVCWSDDGDAPDNSLPGPYTPQQLIDLKIEAGASRKISEKCATCPMSVKGSKVTPQGKAVTACGQHRMLAVLPDPALGLPEPLSKPLRLKIAMTSDWDKQSPAQEQAGWLAFSNYVDWLNARGCKHTAAIVTKMKFDPDAAYPKIFFASERPLEAPELQTIKPLLHSDDVKKLLGGTWTPAGVDGVRKDEQPVAMPQVAGQPETTDQPPAVAAAAAPPPQPAPTAEAQGCPAGYQMSPAEQFSYDDYKGGGWTDEQLIANGKLIAVQAPPAQPEVVVDTPPPPPAGGATETLIVGEPASGAASTTAAGQNSASAEALVITEAQPAKIPDPSPSLAAPAAVVVQEPAQATAPAPVPTPQAPEPTAAAASAAEASPAVSTEVPGDVAALLDAWK